MSDWSICSRCEHYRVAHHKKECGAGDFDDCPCPGFIKKEDPVRVLVQYYHDSIKTELYQCRYQSPDTYMLSEALTILESLLNKEINEDFWRRLGIVQGLMFGCDLYTMEQFNVHMNNIKGEKHV